MSKARVARLLIVVVLLGGALLWVWRTNVKPERVSLVITAVIGAVTAVYALLTYEIVLQNENTAKAAFRSTALMEQNLRFSHAANLLFETMNIKDPTFKSKGNSIIPIENSDYGRALTEFNAGGEQKEFVFAVVSNKGQGAATNLNIEVHYNVTDSSSPNRETSVRKTEAVPILEPKKAVAICVFISKVPTADDRVALVSAHVKAGDFYRDANNEPAKEMKIAPQNHHVERSSDCVIRLT